jgi:hypothetical protein
MQYFPSRTGIEELKFVHWHLCLEGGSRRGKVEKEGSRKRRVEKEGRRGKIWEVKVNVKESHTT